MKRGRSQRIEIHEKYHLIRVSRYQGNKNRSDELITENNGNQFRDLHLIS